MPNIKRSKHVKDFNKDMANDDNEDTSYNRPKQVSRRAPVQLFEFLGSDMQDSVQYNTGNVAAKATGGKWRILSRGDKERDTKHVTFQATDDEFPTVGSVRTKKIKQPTIVAADLEATAVKAVRVPPGAAAAVEVQPKLSTLKPTDEEFPAVGSMRGKKNMQLALVADELKQSAPSAVEAAVGSGNERAAGNDKEATLRAAPGAVQPIQATVAPRTLQPAVAQSSQNKWSMNRQGFVEPQAAGNTALPRHANNTSFDAAFRRVPQTQIRPPSMAPQSSSTGFTPNRFPPAMAMHRSRLSLDTSRPPPLLLPMHRGPPPALDPSRPPPSMLPVNRPRPSLDTSRPPPVLLPWNRPPSQALPAHLLPTPFAPQMVATPRAPSSFVQVAPPTGVRPIVRTVPPMPIHFPGDHRSGLLHNQNASLLRELHASDQPQFHCQAPPQLQSSLNRHAVEFYPRSKLINELIAELNVEPRRRKNSITERRKRQRFYRNLKPDVMFESSEFPPELSPMERSNNFPAGRPIILPLGRPNFPNTRSSSVTAATLERSSFDNGFIRNMGYQRNNLPHGQA